MKIDPHVHRRSIDLHTALLRCISLLMADRVNLRQRNTSVASGPKLTLTEPRSRDQINEYTS